MRKLLLFTLFLFGILSVQSLAWNYGCGENIPPDVCGASNGGNSSGDSWIITPTIGAVAIDPDTGKWASISNTTDRKAAKSSVLERCGADCKVIMVDSKRCVGVAYSKGDKAFGSDSATDNIGGIGYNTRVQRSNEKALKKCEKSGGKNCKVIVNVCAVEGTTKY